MDSLSIQPAAGVAETNQIPHIGSAGASGGASTAMAQGMQVIPPTPTPSSAEVAASSTLVPEAKPFIPASFLADSPLGTSFQPEDDLPALVPPGDPVEESWPEPGGMGVWPNAMEKPAPPVSLPMTVDGPFADSPLPSPQKMLELAVAENTPHIRALANRALDNLAVELGMTVVKTPDEIAALDPAAADAVPLKPIKREVFTNTGEIEAIVQHPGFFPFEHREKFRDYGPARPLNELPLLPKSSQLSPLPSLSTGSSGVPTPDTPLLSSTLVPMNSTQPPATVVPMTQERKPPPLHMIPTDSSVIGCGRHPADMPATGPVELGEAPFVSPSAEVITETVGTTPSSSQEPWLPTVLSGDPYDPTTAGFAAPVVPVMMGDPAPNKVDNCLKQVWWCRDPACKIEPCLDYHTHRALLEVREQFRILEGVHYDEWNLGWKEYQVDWRGVRTGLSRAVEEVEESKR
jgi:hypothetical protein